MNFKLFILLAMLTLCSLILASCGPTTEQAEAEEVKLSGSNGPVVTIFESYEPGSYVGSEGSYVINCAGDNNSGNCTVTVSTNTICLALESGVQIEVKPTISISHNGEITETRLFSEKADGSWVISANPIPYTIEHSDYGELTCHPEVVFTVILPYGGTVTKLP